jgi:hypothetical protein
MQQNHLYCNTLSCRVTGCDVSECMLQLPVHTDVDQRVNLLLKSPQSFIK